MGSGAGAATDRFVAGFERLSERARARLVIENDDRVFGVGDVLRLATRCDLRVVFDLHHHYCHDPDGSTTARRSSAPGDLAGWADAQGALLVAPAGRRHGRRLPDLRAHADLIDPIAFRQFLRHTAAGLDFDVMLEAKAKDLALLRLRTHLDW